MSPCTTSSTFPVHDAVGRKRMGSVSPLLSPSAYPPEHRKISGMHQRITSKRRSSDAGYLLNCSKEGTNTKSYMLDPKPNGYSPLDDAETCEELEKRHGLRVPTPKEVHDAIPAHCKVRDPIHSMFFVLQDILIAAAVVVVARGVITPLAGYNVLVRGMAWVIYAIVEGTVLTGLWVLGHECGHQAFSPYRVLNDLVGFILHTALLVPYFSWKYTHAKHHKFTNHLVWGETHVPHTRKQRSSLLQFGSYVGEDAFAIYELIGHLLIGWPAYLFANCTGGRVNWKGEPFSPDARVNHFVGTNSDLFPPHLERLINISGFGVLAVVCGLAAWGYQYGWMEPVKWYVLPYLVVNAWLVCYTYLHHTHPEIPHYGNESFTWLRGALSTLDRPYPGLIDELHHHIGSTHVLHHVNVLIPHYHAQEGTRALKKALGQLWRTDPTPVWKALMNTFRSCHYVNGTAGVQRYHSLKEFAETEGQRGKPSQTSSPGKETTESR